MLRPVFSKDRRGPRPERGDITGKKVWQAAAAPIAERVCLLVLGRARPSKGLTVERVGVISRLPFDGRTE
jgi:hypothetical protein